MISETNRKWWILAGMSTSISMIFVDITVLPVVLPTLQREFDIGNLGLQWIINAYTLVLAVFVLAGGKLGDRWGLKKAFCFGTCTFAIASAMCGLSSTAWGMILSRCLQGLGGAFLLPATQGIVIAHFPPQERGRAIGLFVGAGSVFLALGPLIGGSLTTYLSWHYVFWINLPIATIGLLMALITVPPMQGKKEPFDTRGFIIQALGFTCVVIALMQAQMWGWTSWETITLLSVGCVFLYWLFHRKHRPKASFFDFALFKMRSFSTSLSCIFINQFLIMVSVFWAIYFQNILGFTSSKAGIYSFFANIPVLFAAPIGGLLVDRFGPRRPVMLGFSIIAFSLGWFLVFLRHESIWLLLPTLLTFGFGISMVFTPSFIGMMNDVPHEKRGSASGINSALRQFSSTLGLALFGAIYSSIYLGSLGKSLHENGSTSSLIPEQFEGLLSRAPEAMGHLQSLSTSNSQYVITSAKAAFLSAFFWVNFLSASFAVMGIVIAWRYLKNRPIHVDK